MPKVRTVLGDIEASELGFTMAHEHVIHCPRGLFAPDNEWALRDFNIQLQMVKDYKAIGGGTLVDAMCRDQDGRCPAYLKVISETTGVHIIAATGIPFDYPGDREPLMDLSIVWKDKDVDEIAAGYVKEITEGMNGTNIKAGWIKAGTQYCYATPGEIKGLKAAARAALATGAAVHTHTDGGSFALEQLEIVLNEGLPGSQFGVAHIDRNPDFWLHKKIAESGAYLIYDGPGKVKYYPDSVRVDLLRRLVDAGFENQIMLSNDMGKKSHHQSYSYGPGWGFIKQKFIPRLLDEGFSEEVVHKFMYENPARFYALRK